VRSLVAVFLILLSSAAPQALLAEDPADRVVVEKAAHRFALYRNGLLIHEYKVALRGAPVGPKIRQGDHRTPEGTYFIEGRNDHSQYYKSLRISYPNETDLQRARELKVSPGGDIMIHGLPNGERFLGKLHLLHDWTEGCIAVTDEEMDEIWALVRVGTPIEIRP